VEGFTERTVRPLIASAPSGCLKPTSI